MYSSTKFTMVLPLSLYSINRFLHLELRSLSLDKTTTKLPAQPISKETKNKTVSKVKRLVNFGCLHIADEAVAKLVSSLIFRDNKSPVLEISPGPGILTRHLLENPKVTQLFAFERRPLYVSQLDALRDQYNHLEIVNLDLSNLPLHMHKTIFGINTIEEVFCRIDPQKWSQPPPLKIVGVISPKKEATFLRYLLRKIPIFESIYSLGRSELLVFISGREFAHLIATEKDSLLAYIGASILYKTLFDFEMIDKFPYSSFEPKMKKRKSVSFNIDPDSLFLVRIVPKIELQEDTFPTEYLPDFAFFINQSYSKRKNLIIPTLEKWIPDCGPRLIKFGLPLFKQFGQLSSKEIFQIFEEIISWPEYVDSTLKAAVSQSIKDDCEIPDEDLE